MTIELGPSEFIGTKIIKQNMIFITRFYHKTKNSWQKVLDFPFYEDSPILFTPSPSFKFVHHPS